MKRLLLVLAFAAATGWAQPIGGGGVPATTVDPTGLACRAGAATIYSTTGGLFTCQSGVFALVSGGGTGTGTLTNTAASLVAGKVIVGNGYPDVIASVVFIDANGVNSADGFTSVGAATGTLAIAGATSGNAVTQTVNASTPAWTFTWPQAAAASSTWLTTNSSGIASFTQPNYTDLAGVLPSPGASTLGGVESIDCTGIGHILKISTAGVPSCSADSGGAGSSTQYYANAQFLGVGTGATNYFPLQGSNSATAQTSEAKTPMLVPANCNVTKFSAATITGETAGGTSLSWVAMLRYGATIGALADTVATCTVTTSSGGVVAAGTACTWTPGTTLSVVAGGWWDIRIVNSTSAATGYLSTVVVCQ
jgi:hypothetical protein